MCVIADKSVANYRLSGDKYPNSQFDDQRKNNNK